MRTIFPLLIGAVLIPVGAAEPPQKAEAEPAARVVVTAEVACLCCLFGEEGGCATALKLDEKTPLVLEGKAAEDLFKVRLDKKVAVVEGSLQLKGKRLVLVADKSRILNDKEKAAVKDPVYVEGPAICGRCDLAVCNECTLAVKNGDSPIILQGRLAADHAEGKGVIGVTGKLRLDEQGLLRLHASKVETKNK